MALCVAIGRINELYKKSPIERITMLALEFSNQEVHLKHVHLRQELHGTENHLAVDLKIIVETNSEILANFAPDLRAALFKKDLENAGSETVRFPKASPIKWADGMTGATVTVHQGLLGAITLTDAKVNNFVLEAREGGAVALQLRVQAPCDGEPAGKLAELMKSKVEITLKPAELAEMSDPE